MKFRRREQGMPTLILAPLLAAFDAVAKLSRLLYR